MKKTCIILMGPTAVGKTALGIKLAEHFSTEIISADSRQCFKELNIGVAKPTARELQITPHHFINSHSIFEAVNAATFENYALQKIKEIFSCHDIAIMVGGTGLYINAFCEGMDEIPVIDPGIRQKVIEEYKLNGIGWLQNEIGKSDPAYFRNGEIKNPHRLMRALEVKLSTGKSILDYQTNNKATRDFKITRIGLELPKDELHERINHRVETMISNGLVEEVKTLEAYKGLNALQTVGYKEIFDFLEGTIKMPKAIEAIKQHTRHYAKRQVTWFKKDKDIQWCSPNYEQLLETINL